jgi:RNA recognition motif-containing protein
MEESQQPQNDPAAGSHQNGSSTSHDDVEGKIFVGGLSWQTTEESMRFHFEKFGELSDVAIMTDKRTGQPR